jgi:hypothetical protein
MSESPRIGLYGGPATRFYLVIDGQRKGPFALEELPERGLEHDTLVWHTGLSEWLRADKIPALREVLLTIPPPLPETPPPLSPRRPSAVTPEVFHSLCVWWLLLLGGAVGLPLLGGLSFTVAQTQYERFNGPWGVYWDYNGLGRALVALGGVLTALGGLSLVASVAIFAVFLYKVWDVVQDGRARATPERAVGFLFIPFFNLYWVFVAIHGLALDLDRALRRQGRADVAPPSPGLALAFCVLWVCTWVPYLNLVAVIPMLVVLILLVLSFKRAAAALAAGRRPAPSRPSDAAPDAITQRRPTPEAL